jgi:hypothetical protein
MRSGEPDLLTVVPDALVPFPRLVLSVLSAAKSTV